MMMSSNHNHNHNHNQNQRNGNGRFGSTTPHHQLLTHHQRRGGNNSDDLDLFSNTRRSLSPDHSSDVSVKIGRVSVGAPKLSSSSTTGIGSGIGIGIEDLLLSSSNHVDQQDDGEGKHDYDWLLTPPGTPVFPSSQSESQQPPSLVPPTRRTTTITRSTSTTKASRLSVSQSDTNNHNHPRPARSSSVTRPSISTSHSQTHYTTYSSNRSSSSSILNTSSASVSSYIRPSSPATRSQSSVTRPSTPSSRTTPSRPSTPSKPRSLADKTRPSPQNSRPSTPSSRPQIPANLHSTSAPSTRSLSRPSTPTRRNSMPSSSPTTASSGRVSLNGRNSAPVSRPSSPSPRPRPVPQPVVPPDFPLDTPPNLRTTLPDRPLSAGRSRPGASTLKTNSETQPSSVNNISRRHSSPIVGRGRLTEPSAGKNRVYGNSNGHNHVDVPEPRKLSHAPEVGARRLVKSSTTATDNTGFGRTISKKSLDMAIKHMDIRNGSGNLRALSNTTLFPQSIRSSTPKSQSHRVSSAPASGDMHGSIISSNNGTKFDAGNNINQNMMINGRDIDERQQYSAKLSEVDIYESSRYDALLLKEDLKNTDWLHSADDKCDQDPIFGNGFEHLPEPFGLL